MSYQEIPRNMMKQFVKDNYYLTEIIHQLDINNIFVSEKDINGNAKYSCGIDFCTGKSTGHKTFSINHSCA
jgi:hypothetical protein